MKFSQNLGCAKFTGFFTGCFLVTGYFTWFSQHFHRFSSNSAIVIIIIIGLRLYVVSSCLGLGQHTQCHPLRNARDSAPLFWSSPPRGCFKGSSYFIPSHLHLLSQIIVSNLFLSNCLKSAMLHLVFGKA